MLCKHSIKYSLSSQPLGSYHFNRGLRKCRNILMLQLCILPPSLQTLRETSWSSSLFPLSHHSHGLLTPDRAAATAGIYSSWLIMWQWNFFFFFWAKAFVVQHQMLIKSVCNGCNTSILIPLVVEISETENELKLFLPTADCILWVFLSCLWK